MLRILSKGRQIGGSFLQQAERIIGLPVVERCLGGVQELIFERTIRELLLIPRVELIGFYEC